MVQSAVDSGTATALGLGGWVSRVVAVGRANHETPQRPAARHRVGLTERSTTSSLPLVSLILFSLL